MSYVVQLRWKLIVLFVDIGGIVDLQFRWELIVLFVDIGGIVDFHCLNFLFIMETTVFNVFH